MKLTDVMNAIHLSETRSNVKGYLVCFERRERGLLITDYFPEVGMEPAITSEDEAWDLANKFANAVGKEVVCNVYVVYASNYSPVTGYRDRVINKY